MRVFTLSLILCALGATTASAKPKFHAPEGAWNRDRKILHVRIAEQEMRIFDVNQCGPGPQHSKIDPSIQCAVIDVIPAGTQVNVTNQNFFILYGGSSLADYFTVAEGHFWFTEVEYVVNGETRSGVLAPFQELPGNPYFKNGVYSIKPFLSKYAARQLTGEI